MEILKTHNLKKYYGEGSTVVKALDGVNLSAQKGEFAAIVGTSGSGKSTLLHMLGGLDRATEGSVTVDGTDILSLRTTSLPFFAAEKLDLFFKAITWCLC